MIDLKVGLRRNEVSKEKNPKVKNVRVIHFLNYLIFFGIIVFFSASCTKEEKGDEINRNQQIEEEETKRSSEAFNKNNELWTTLDDPIKDGWSTEKLADDAQLKLKEIEKFIIGKTKNEKVTILSPNFLFIGFEEKTLEKCLESETFQTWKQSEKTRRVNLVKDEFLDYLKNNYTSQAQEVKTKFKIISVSGDDKRFATRVLTSISFKSKSHIIDERSEWLINWENKKQGSNITKIEVQKLEKTKKDGPEKVFVDCTESLFSSNQSYENQLTKGVNYWLERLPAYAMLNRFGTPGITIADVNNDGLEDLYLCQEPGIPNKLFIQMNDGKLKDYSAKFGVNWLEDSRSSLIIDLDNDGYRDLVVAMYGYVLIAKNRGLNNGFQVIDIIPTNESNTSLASADFDLDGKLDIYVCCYAPNKSSDSTANLVMGGASRRFIYHDDNNGPNNFMLKNVTSKGGEISFINVTEEVGLNSNNNKWSFAASWEDFDNDGDPDLYVANDYGKNNLYQNEYGKFKDIASNLDVEDSASGMSVSWGDYDLDGRMDLYVSNMFSSAGNRITTQSQFKPTTNSDTRSRFKRFARGNTLFKNVQEGFKDDSQKAEVTMGRWAWGSKFVDFNNDGWEDIVIANGYLSSDEDDTGDL